MKASVISVIGAGGKTSLVHALAAFFRMDGKTVLVTTAAHMKKEEGVLFSEKEILSSLSSYGYAFAGTPDPENENKITGLQEEILERMRFFFDIIIFEADGARGLPFKAPYEWEPPVPAFSDIVYLVMGMDAAGHRIKDVCYNPEGVAASLCVNEETVLTEELMEDSYRKTYFEKLKEKCPGAFVRIVRNPKDFFEIAGPPVYHCIELAAGFSKRYGSNKLLEKIGGKHMYRHVLDRLLLIRREGRIPIDITVVTQYEEILRDIKDENLNVLVNPDPARGISSSLRTAVGFLQKCGKIKAWDFLMFFPADQPDLRKESIEDFISAFEYSSLPLGCMGYGGNLKSPCIFSAEYLPDLMRLTGDRGGKRILEAAGDKVYLFDDIEPEELEDRDIKC